MDAIEKSAGVTQLLIDLGGGDAQALEEMTPLVYQELRRLARYYLRRERPGHTLQPTALVHEVYFRLIDQRRVDWRNRAQFLGLAASMMRRILVNHARDRAAAKRGGDAEKVSLRFADEPAERAGVDVLALSRALDKLAAIDARKGRVVELKFFGGPDHRGDRPRPRHLAGHRRARVELRARLAVPGAGRRAMTAEPPEPTSPETWRRVDELFHAALDLGDDSAAVDAFLDRSCGGDGALRGQVARLLAAHSRAGTFLEGSASTQLADLLAGDGHDLDGDEASAVGRQIGAYRLIEEIGRGGMGAVYLAERADDAYRKRVAIKLIKGGMDGGAVIRHFRNERQILASLEHANIARLLDGGTAATGRRTS